MAVLITVVPAVPRKTQAHVGGPLPVCETCEQAIQADITNFEHKNQIQVIPLRDLVVPFFVCVDERLSFPTVLADCHGDS